MAKEIFARVYAVVEQIPYGRVVTYGQIARHLGMPSGARTVGWALRACPEGLPWHRVVNAQGGVSARGRDAGTSVQRALLEEEGVLLGAHDRIDLGVYGWDGI
ncbi:MAG: methylated-DNA--[protein]-cysteine S-methyltransferase [Anaerolineae bacterium]|nr:methylated-DNA--[protein]-cysteine S-methyltransferase [Anaerolineae bacterium]